MPDSLQKTGSMLLACLLLAACSNESAAPANGNRGGPAKVVTAAVELKPLVDEIEALGTATANESINIQPRISSLITRIAFDEGEIVEEGDLLIELESSETAAGLALAEATLAESESLYARSQSLASSKAISAADLEQLLARVKIDQAQVQAARARLANTNIRAPFTGRVGLRRVSPGSYVDPSTVITTLDDVGIIKLDFSIPETFLTVVSDGMAIAARSVVFPERVFEGTVASVDTRLDPVSRSVQVRATLPNDDAALKPGMFLTVDLKRDSGDVLVVPEQSIVPEGTRQFVFVVNDGIAKKRPVSLGRRIPGFVVIEEGVAAGEHVVTEGTGKVRDGSEVQTLDEPTSLVRSGSGG